MTKAKPTPASIDETLAVQGFADDAAGEAARTALLDDAAVIKTVQLTPEEIAAAEAQRLADEAAAAEAQRLADEAAAAEAQRLADEATTAEAARFAEVAAAAEAKPVLDMAWLRGLIAEIEASNNTLQQFRLVEALRANSDALIDTSDAYTLVRLAGIEVCTQGGRTVALATWCSKARRAILNGEAV